MKNAIYLCFIIALLCLATSSNAASRINRNSVQSTHASYSYDMSRTLSFAVTDVNSDDVEFLLPRGRGTGRGPGKVLALGFLSLFPFLSFVFAPFAFFHGFQNIGRGRKFRLLSFIGMLFATAGLTLTIVIIALI